MRFAVVGIAATLIHAVVGLILLRAGVAPLLANPLGFVVAFLVSFLGHHFWSFRHHGTGMRYAALRFVPVAVLGFLISEMLLGLLLPLIQGTIALPLALLCAAGITFLLSRHWAFARQ